MTVRIIDCTFLCLGIAVVAHPFVLLRVKVPDRKFIFHNPPLAPGFPHRFLIRVTRLRLIERLFGTAQRISPAREIISEIRAAGQRRQVHLFLRQGHIGILPVILIAVHVVRLSPLSVKIAFKQEKDNVVVALCLESVLYRLAVGRHRVRQGIVFRVPHFIAEIGVVEICRHVIGRFADRPLRQIRHMPHLVNVTPADAGFAVRVKTVDQYAFRVLIKPDVFGIGEHPPAAPYLRDTIIHVQMFIQRVIILRMRIKLHAFEGKRLMHHLVPVVQVGLRALRRVNLIRARGCNRHDGMVADQLRQINHAGRILPHAVGIIGKGFLIRILIVALAEHRIGITAFHIHFNLFRLLLLRVGVHDIDRAGRRHRGCLIIFTPQIRHDESVGPAPELLLIVEPPGPVAVCLRETDSRQRIIFPCLHIDGNGLAAVRGDAGHLAVRPERVIAERVPRVIHHIAVPLDPVFRIPGRRKFQIRIEDKLPADDLLRTVELRPEDRLIKRTVLYPLRKPV